MLIADPDPDVLESTAILVASLGYEPIPVDQAADLLGIVEAERPGLVLLETQFPGLNVAGLVASLRAFPPTAALPVALFSAAKDLAATAVRHGAWAFLAKPFSRRELAQLLRRALGPSPAMAQAGAGRTLEREVRDAFRELRNLATALGNYLAVLEQAPELSRASRLAVRRMADVALKMEARSEHARAFVLGMLVPAVEPEPRPERPEGRRAGRPPAAARGRPEAP